MSFNQNLFQVAVISFLNRLVIGLFNILTYFRADPSVRFPGNSSLLANLHEVYIQIGTGRLAADGNLCVPTPRGYAFSVVLVRCTVAQVPVDRESRCNHKRPPPEAGTPSVSFKSFRSNRFGSLEMSSINPSVIGTRFSEVTFLLLT